jgi:hypothetical protein
MTARVWRRKCLRMRLGRELFRNVAAFSASCPWSTKIEQTVIESIFVGVLKRYPRLQIV